MQKVVGSNPISHFEKARDLAAKRQASPARRIPAPYAETWTASSS
jgi:hypothetical protein